MTETKPTYTTPRYGDTAVLKIGDDIGVNCPGCEVAITISNAGGYRTYCEKCTKRIEALHEAQTAVVAMLKECNLSQVLISEDGEHNRFSPYGSNVYYTFNNLGELWQKRKPPPQWGQRELL